MKNDEMLWPVAVPPINLCDVSRDINDHARMELIKLLVCDSGPNFSIQELRTWINDPLRDDWGTPDKAEGDQP